MEKLKAGQKVQIKEQISRASYFLYKDFKDKSEIMICPCELKGRIVVVVEHFDNNSVLCLFKDAFLTILYPEDTLKIEDGNN